MPDTTTAHILIVDDEAEIRDLVTEYLTDEGLRVSSAADSTGMREVLAREAVDLVILDIKLPGEDGLTLAAELRQQENIGLVMLSQKDDLVDRVAGLEVGADDYVAKPFHLRELLARLRSVLRRQGPRVDQDRITVDPPVNGVAPKLRFAGWEMDRRTRQLRAPDGDPVELSTGEFDLLLAFLENPKPPLSRDTLLDLVHDREAALFDRSIDVQIGRLRRKIEANPKRPELIKTVRGVGYVFKEDVESDPPAA
ncbi:response regulator [Thalassobaculum sp.]|uniref:response regulator n=1 Tax=Thalassobaculum sp. TaxID=2022740 RepID=UPI003B5AEF4A